MRHRHGVVVLLPPLVRHKKADWSCLSIREKIEEPKNRKLFRLKRGLEPKQEIYNFSF